jgi:GTP cyclohydrolase II
MRSYNQTMALLNVRKVAEADFPSRWAHFRIHGFVGERNSTAPPPGCSSAQQEEMVALVLGNIHAQPPLVRIHSQCLTGDVLGSLRCDCRMQLELALEKISQAGAGILLYEMQEGRGIGLMPKLQAYALQDAGMDTVEANEHLGFQADCRQFEMPAAVLQLLGVPGVRLMTNNPEKVAALESAGIRVVERVSASVQPVESFAKYLQVKREKLGHLQEP